MNSEPQRLQFPFTNVGDGGGYNIMGWPGHAEPESCSGLPHRDGSAPGYLSVELQGEVQASRCIYSGIITAHTVFKAIKSDNQESESSKERRGPRAEWSVDHSLSETTLIPDTLSLGRAICQLLLHVSHAESVKALYPSGAMNPGQAQDPRRAHWSQPLNGTLGCISYSIAW